MNYSMRALVKKDFTSVVNNKLLFSRLLILPLVMSILIPTVFILTIHFAPIDRGAAQLMSTLPSSEHLATISLTLSNLLINYILPLFFLTIPIMAGATMAASSFVGEKERHTLETLLFCPMSLKEIFKAKVLASLYLSLIVSAISFVLMFIVVQAESYFILGEFARFGLNWLFVIFLIVPSVSMIAITLIVRESAKAKSVEESQQAAGFLILPLVFLIFSQLAGFFLASPIFVFFLGLACALIAWILLNGCIKGFTYEKLID